MLPKKILVLAEWFPPGYKAGGPIRSCENFSQAMAAYYDIYVVTTNTDFGSDLPYKDIVSNQWISVESNLSVIYYSKNQITKETLNLVIDEIMPDFVYLNSLFSFNFAILPLFNLRKRTKNIKVVLAPRGMLHQGALQFKKFKKKSFLTLAKALGLFKNVSFQATDLQEKKDIIKHIGSSSIVEVVPNFPSQKINTFEQINKITGKVRLVFISRISPKKNLLFFLQLLKESKSKIQFDIYGNKEDLAYIESCRKVIESLPQHVKVNFNDEIPNHQVLNTLAQYHLFILPTHGENFGHAIFEAFQAGRPVLISDQTPWRDLESKKIGWDVPLKKPNRFLEIVEDVAQMNQQEWLTMAKNSHLFAKKYINNPQLINEYINLFSKNG